MDACPIQLRKERLEVRLSEELLKKNDIELDEDEEWMPVLASFVSGRRLFLVVAFPWIPEEGESEDDEREWFIPLTVSEKDVEAMRFRRPDGDDIRFMR